MTHKNVSEQELIENNPEAERVSLAMVNASIVGENYFNARQAADALGQPSGQALDLLTICVLTLWNGYTVVGKSACADPANYNEDIGRRLARTDAVNQIWALMGYELKSRMARDQKKLADAVIGPRAGFDTYIGTKLINARPMTLGSYKAMRCEAREMVDHHKPGYLVVYTDRVENLPNTNGFSGYISWSPKEVFERAYRVVRPAAPASRDATAPAVKASARDITQQQQFQNVPFAG